MRRVKLDENHAGILADLRKVFGSAVKDTSRLGDGWPDVMVARHGYLIGIEIKRPGPPSARKIRESQAAHKAWCDRYGVPYAVVQNSAEAIDAVMREPVRRAVAGGKP